MKKIDCQVDFRNNSLSKIKELITNTNFNNEKIKNFFKQFKIQNISSIGELKRVRNISIFGDIFSFQPLELVKSIIDNAGNEKFLFKTFDNFFIESVLMSGKKNISICVSTQIGCKLNCLICNAGKHGFKRDLMCSEILEQIRQIYLMRIYPQHLSCISFMGMGEPFDNLNNCMLAVEWISSDWCWSISRKKITFSTSGCLTFDNFFTYKKLPNLAVSLHSAIQEKRKIIMPAALIPLSQLKKSMLTYTERTKKQISIEYCLINNFNDTREDALSLAEYIKDLPCKINLLNYNKTIECDFNPVSNLKLEKFMSILKKNNIAVIHRKSFGAKIGAACGQLGISHKQTV